MDIDWSKAPKGATHAIAYQAKPGDCDFRWVWANYQNRPVTFHDIDDVLAKRTSYVMTQKAWDIVSCRDSFPNKHAWPLPLAWTGYGKPPVGTKVTIETNGLRIWKEAEVFIGRTSEVVATFKLIESDMVVVYLEEENACCVFRASMCRPPKTAEQLKAEADARATSVLTGELEHLVLVSERLGPSELAEKLIRLNYRKQTDQ